MKTHKSNFVESTFPYTTDWPNIIQYKVKIYVNKLQQRTYRAESVKDYRTTGNHHT